MTCPCLQPLLNSLKKWLTLRSLIPGLVLLSILGSNALIGDDDWVTARYNDITFISNDSPKRLKSIVGEVHLFTKFVTESLHAEQTEEQWPLRVFLCKSEESFGDLAPLDDKFRDKVNGFFVAGMGYDLIVVRTTSKRNHAREVLFHELTHRIAVGFGEIPLWIDEGLAECYSSFKLRKNSIDFGRHQRTHLRWINNNGLMPLRKLLRVHHDSPEYNESTLSGSFYATAWIFTHYCLFGEPDTFKKALWDYVEAHRLQFPSEASFQKHFGMGFKDMEERLVRYARKFSLPKSEAFTFETSEREIELEFQPLESEHFQVLRAGALTLSDRTDDAKVLLSNNPDFETDFRLHSYSKDLTRIHPITESVLVSYYTGDFETAQRKAEEAFSYGDRSPIVLLVYAEKLLKISPEQSISSATKVSRENVNRAFFCVNKVLGLDNRNRNALRLYSLAWFRSLVEPNRKQVDTLYRHLELQPNDLKLHLITADMFQSWHRWEDVTRVLVQFIDNNDYAPDIEKARDRLDRVRQYIGRF
jgi:hypothetical protein